jgi:hypothetical protein
MKKSQYDRRRELRGKEPQRPLGTGEIGFDYERLVLRVKCGRIKCFLGKKYGGVRNRRFRLIVLHCKASPAEQTMNESGDDLFLILVVSKYTTAP